MNEGLCSVLRRIARAKSVGDAVELNSSLVELSRLADALFRAKIERRLEDYAETSRGYSVSMDDACDVLNEILWLVCQKAGSFRGQTDAEAYCWLKQIVERRMLDKGRVLARRAKKWREVFALVPKRLKGLLETTRNDER